MRVLGDLTTERVEIARKADHIFISMIKEAGIYNEVGFMTSSTSNVEQELTLCRCLKHTLVWIPTKVGIRICEKAEASYYAYGTNRLVSAVGVMGDTRVYGYIIM